MSNPLEELAFQTFLNHPLPWKIEQDWTWEVIASDGHIVAKCPSREEADAVVAWAEAKEHELAVFEAELELDGSE